MLVNQQEIDTLTAQAEAPLPTPAMPTFSTSAPDVRRILRIRAPLIVQLARRSMRVAEIRRISIGMIVEFEKGVDEPLELLVNNRVIGLGQTVKVGEKFGLRLQHIHSPAQRVRSLGAEDES